jgi:Fe-S cluster assembly scaffold protein SufB
MLYKAIWQNASLMKEIKAENGRMLEIRGNAAVRVPEGAKALISVKAAGRMRLEISAGRNSTVSCFTICESEASLTQENILEEGALMRNSSLWLSGADARVRNILRGPRAGAYDVHVFVQGGNRRLRLDSSLRHSAKDTRGDILVKGVVRDRASAALKGMIKIDKGAPGAESFLAEHVMLLDEGAHASANPELEIENNDVSSRHAASVTQIDPEKLFYLMSRGIAPAEGKRLVVEGFLESAVSRISDDSQRRRFMDLAMRSLGEK